MEEKTTPQEVEDTKEIDSNEKLEGNKEVVVSLDDVLKNKELQSEFDKRIAQAIKTSKSKWETETKKRQAEAERQAKMTAEEKLKEREQLLAKKEAELDRIAKINSTKEKLTERNLPVIFAENIVLGNEEEDIIDEKINNLQEIFSSAVEQTVNKKLAGQTPAKTKSKSFVRKEERAF